MTGRRRQLRTDASCPHGLPIQPLDAEQSDDLHAEHTDGSATESYCTSSSILAELADHTGEGRVPKLKLWLQYNSWHE